MERSAAERDNENFIQNLKQQKALAEQDLANVTAEFKALKVIIINYYYQLLILLSIYLL